MTSNVIKRETDTVFSSLPRYGIYYYVHVSGFSSAWFFFFFWENCKYWNTRGREKEYKVYRKNVSSADWTERIASRDPPTNDYTQHNNSKIMRKKMLRSGKENWVNVVNTFEFFIINICSGRGVMLEWCGTFTFTFMVECHRFIFSRRKINQGNWSVLK